MKSPQTRERLAMVLVTIVLCFGFFTLYNNLKKQFGKIEAGYKDKSVLVLNNSLNENNLSDLLVTGNYILDEQDARFIAKYIKTKVDNGVVLPNLGELNKKSFRIPAFLADSLGGAGLKLRVDSSLSTLGVTTEVAAIYTQSPADTYNFHEGNCSIRVMVQEKDKIPVAGVLVRLKQHYYVTTDTVKKSQEAQDSIVGYALTNKKGLVTFNGLNKEFYYSVLPVKKGFEYGASQGTTRGNLGETMKKNIFQKIKHLFSGDNSDFTFLQREHQITPFDTLTYQRLKEDNALTVRTLSQFKSDLIVSLIFFFIAWWSLSFFLRDRSLLLPILMALSGIGLLMMYSIINPLTDTLLGKDMAIGAIVGVVLLGIISKIDFSKFFNSKYQWFGWLRHFKKFKRHNFPEIQFDFVMQFLNWAVMPFEKKIQPNTVVSKKNLGSYRLKLILKLIVAILFFPIELILRFIRWIAAPLIKPVAGMQGVGYLILALVLLVLLWRFGSGPEGSGVKVNLFFFQPSEIIKYLIILFLAAFFKNNAEKIQKFSEIFDWKHIKAQTKTVAAAILGLLILLGWYFILGDMGPALVLAVTFVIIYSVVRRDLWQLLAGTVSFIALLFLGYRFNPDPLTLAGFAALWLFLWLGYGLRKPKKQLYESAIFMNILISAFVFGGPLMKSAGFERLQDRNDICLSGVWDNEVRGGDQVVQGLWSASTGGLTGQGLGGGNPNLTPAFHTDMIFTSIGEEMGWIGLLLIIFCMALLIHRSLHIGYKSGNSFLFFLATGIAVVTGIQFLVITLGSVGLIPLTGVAVPFLSFGKTSLIINLAAFGILLSISKKQATELQAQDFKEKQYHQMVGVGSFAYWSISIVLLGFLFWTQFLARDTYLIRPAYVTNQQGERVVEYNPRISLLIKNMEAGNIYDRNGTVLATNNKDLIKQQIDSGKFTDVDKDIYTKELKQRKQRYYPFGKHLFFWLGDYNTKVLWNNRDSDPRGYIAESRHLAALRGFNNLQYEDSAKTIIKKGILKAKSYKGSSFLYPVEKDGEYTDYDYSVILPLLKDGINGNKVDAWNEERKNRDITLTVDAVLQTRMQNMIEAYVNNPKKFDESRPENYFKGKEWNKLRISVVVLNAQNGDLLCSANYPLPEQDTLRYKPDYSDVKNLSAKAYTDRDLGLTFQTAPGSTAKVMSALAGLQKSGATGLQELGVKVFEHTPQKKYYIYHDEIIERSKNSDYEEPNNHIVSMEEAIVISSNCYFINLVNDQNLYPQLDTIYSSIGIRIDKEFYTDGKLRNKALTPYYLDYRKPDKNYKEEIDETAKKGINKYNDYIASRNKNHHYEIMHWDVTGWAWGQGTMRATPLNMARVASIVANGGNFVPTQFILKGNGKVKKTDYKPIPIVSNNEDNVLKGFMIKESDKHRGKGYTFPLGLDMGGKTGTPEREMAYTTQVLNKKTGEYKTVTVNADLDNRKDGKMNDGWYIFFINSPKEQAPLAVAVRMERLGAGISGNAVRLTDKVVLKALSKYFEQQNK